MAKRNKISDFNTYRDQQNAEASYAAFSMGLGINPLGTTTVTTNQKVTSIIEDTLEQEGLGALKQQGLVGLLAAKLIPLVKKEGPVTSMLDLHTHGLTDPDKIKSFLRAHGVNLKDDNDQKYVQEVFDESITFYDEYIAKPSSKIHKDLRHTETEQGIHRIFLTAAGHGKKILIPQACGLLRIAYVTDFMKHDDRITLMPKVTKELDAIVNRHVRTKDGKKFYHSGRNDTDPIRLVEATRRSKTPDRIRAKLLHKPSSHTSDVLDHIGFRFVTESASDTLRLIYKMFFDPKETVLPSTHIRIGKTKQRLVATQKLQEALKSGSAQAATVFATLSELTSDDKDLDLYSVGGTENKYTSDQYRAIQITVEIPLNIDGRRILFPTEIQFLDKSALVRNEQVASHPEYVGRQTADIVKRLLENNLHTGFEENK